MRLLLAALLIAGLPVGLNAQSNVVHLLPTEQWQFAGKTPLTLSQIADYGADVSVDRDFGVHTITLRQYQLAGRHASVLVEESPDASASYGLLLYYQTAAMRPLGMLPYTLIGPDAALLARGPYFMRIRRPQSPPLSESQFISLIVSAGGTGAYLPSMAGLPHLLPANGLVPGSEKYAFNSSISSRIVPELPAELVGYDRGAEIQVGSYGAGKKRMRLVAIAYPTPQMAGQQFTVIEKALRLNEPTIGHNVYGRKQGSFVLLVLDSADEAAANAMLGRFKLEESVTWNQRYPGSGPVVLQVVNLLLANAILVGILLAFAIVGGILIFITKQLTVKWFPNSGFAQATEGRLTRLNLN
jgi:hypothetical protein